MIGQRLVQSVGRSLTRRRDHGVLDITHASHDGYNYLTDI